MTSFSSAVSSDTAGIHNSCSSRVHQPGMPSGVNRYRIEPRANESGRPFGERIPVEQRQRACIVVQELPHQVNRPRLLVRRCSWPRTKSANRCAAGTGWSCTAAAAGRRACTTNSYGRHAAFASGVVAARALEDDLARSLPTEPNAPYVFTSSNGSKLVFMACSSESRFFTGLHAEHGHQQHQRDGRADPRGLRRLGARGRATKLAAAHARHARSSKHAGCGHHHQPIQEREVAAQDQRELKPRA